MARRRVIVGIGEALLMEHPDGDEPAGLAMLVAMRAALLGHDGIAISRLGQDDAGIALLEKLGSLGLDVSHLQTDPDLPTARARAGAAGRGRPDAGFAHDNLQWDADLADVAHRADGVVFGALTRESGQARSTTDRFLAECTLALRLFDLTDSPGDRINRGHALSGLRLAEAAAITGPGLAQMVPGARGGSPRDAAVEMIREGELAFLLLASDQAPYEAHTATSSWSGEHVLGREAHEAVVVAMLHAVLAGREAHDALRFAEQMGRHVADHPGEAIPAEML